MNLDIRTVALILLIAYLMTESRKVLYALLSVGAYGLITWIPTLTKLAAVHTEPASPLAASLDAATGKAWDTFLTWPLYLGGTAVIVVLALRIYMHMAMKPDPASLPEELKGDSAHAQR